MISLNENGIGGFKECVFMITGQGAYSRLKYESGVHRVQRVPETESGGRIHTSTITVAIMPEAEEVDVVIDEKDIRIDVMRASGKRRTVRQHHGFGCSSDPLSHRYRDLQPDGENPSFRTRRRRSVSCGPKLYDLEMEKAAGI